MKDESANPPTPRVRRRWLRFRLRTLFVLLTIIAVFLGWRANRAYHQRVAVARLYELGGFGSYDYQIVIDRVDDEATPPGPAWFSELVGRDFYCDFVMAVVGARPAATDEDLALFESLPGLKHLAVFDQKDVSNNGLVHLASLGHLEQLTLKGLPRVTDAGLANLRRVSRLQGLAILDTGMDGSVLAELSSLPIKNLSLTGNNLSSEHLIHLQHFSELRWLHVEGSQIDNSAIPLLMKLEQLESLFIRSQHVDDTAVAAFRRLPNLRHLEVSETAITPDGAQRLAKLLPSTRVEAQRRD